MADNSANSTPSLAADMTGMGLSLVCLVHCLGLPLVMTTVHGLAWTQHVALHVLLAISAIFVAAWVYRRTPNARHRGVFVTLAAIGVVALFAGVFWPTELGERVITIGGALVLGAAHFFNWMTMRPRKA